MEKATSKISWIHISDLHYYCENESIESPVVESNTTVQLRSDLFPCLKALAKSKGKFDYLFITGDLRFKMYETDTYPPTVGSFISNENWKEILFNPKNIFIVPGNHDVNRKKIDGEFDKEKGEFDEIDGKINKNSLGNKANDENYINKFKNEALKGFTNTYREFLNMDQRWPKGSLHYNYEDKEVNILHLNTSVTCYDSYLDTKLSISPNLFIAACESINNDKPTIVLAHHDIDCFRKEERNLIENQLKSCNTILYLCGHAHHEGRQTIFKANREKIYDQFTCGTFLDAKNNKGPTDMVFFIGEYDTVSKKGEVAEYRGNNSDKWNRVSSHKHLIPGIYLHKEGELSMLEKLQDLGITEIIQEEKELKYFENTIFEEATEIKALFRSGKGFWSFYREKLMNLLQKDNIKITALFEGYKDKDGKIISRSEDTIRIIKNVLSAVKPGVGTKLKIAYFDEKDFRGNITILRNKSDAVAYFTAVLSHENKRNGDVGFRLKNGVWLDACERYFDGIPKCDEIELI